MNGYAIGSIVIAAGSSVSAGYKLGSGSLVALLMPPVFTGSSISFLISTDGGQTYSDFYVDGNEFVVPVAINQYVIFDRGEFEGITQFKIRAGSSDSPVIQEFDASISLIGGGAAVTPNLCNALDVLSPGYVGTFQPFWITDNRVVTLNLSQLMNCCTDECAPPETILCVENVSLTVIGPIGTTDPTPEVRIIGPASIDGMLVSLRLGNWQQDVAYIMYLLSMTVTTNQDNSWGVEAYVVVNGLPY